ncbi:MAG TPA: hypothetical protein VFI11_02730 [Anaerolineales bacterium]|nr:hypothetical protein [Anaerolineales bacterium]
MNEPQDQRPPSGRLDRWLWAFALPASLVWLSLEERSRTGAILIALPWVLLTVRHAYARWMRQRGGIGLIVACVLGGGLIGPMAVVMMALKVALHAHPVPDYQSDDLQALLAWLPTGAVVGFLFGAGLMLLKSSRSRRSDE